MTVEEIMALDMDGIESRSAELATEIETDGADLETLSAEMTALEERKAALVEERKATIEAVAQGAGTEIEKREEKKVMTIEEVRASKEYMNAYATYLKTGDDAEVRSVLTETGTSSATTAGVPVPTYVEEAIRTAWDKNDILSKIRRTEIKGNLKVGFEISASDAEIHTEGAAAPTEETLNLGIVTLVPETIKKWITFSDEVMDMDGQKFAEYIVAEIENKLVKKAADLIIADILNSPSTATTTAPAVATVATSGLADVINAVALLSDEATNPVCIMNKASYAYYKGLAIAANYSVDPFDGLQVIFNDTLDSASDTPGAGVTNNIMIVGDLDGVQANFPAGYEPVVKFDDLSLAELDLIKAVGRLPMAHGVTASGRFTVVTKTGA